MGKYVLWAAVALTAACAFPSRPEQNLPPNAQTQNAGGLLPENTEKPNGKSAASAQAASALSSVLPDSSSVRRQETPRPDDGQKVSCESLSLPASSEPNISCQQNSDGFCAHFENGKMFYCQTADGTRTYQSNKWASSLTFTHRDAKGRPLMLYYYAYGKLARTEEHDYAAGVVTRVWYDPAQIRLTRTAPDGRVLDKYYFTEGKPYVRYPGGNDMGEINGEWRLEGDHLLTDGKLLYTLSRPPQPQWTTGWELIK